MAGPVPRRPMTLDELPSLPEGEWKYELQVGWLLGEPHPGGKHGRLASRVGELLGGYVRRHRLGVVFANDTWFVLSRSPDTARGPDVAFVTRERFEAVGDVGRWAGCWHRRHRVLPLRRKLQPKQKDDFLYYSDS